MCADRGAGAQVQPPACTSLSPPTTSPAHPAHPSPSRDQLAAQGLAGGQGVSSDHEAAHGGLRRARGEAPPHASVAHSASYRHLSTHVWARAPWEARAARATSRSAAFMLAAVGCRSIEKLKYHKDQGRDGRAAGMRFWR